MSHSVPTISLPEKDPQALAILEEIETVISKIKWSNVQGYGTFSDYEELFRVANSVSKIKLQLDTGNIDYVAEKANQISELLNSFIVTIPTYINLISVEDLNKIKNSLLIFLEMLETIENFTFTIQTQFIIRNSLVVNNLSQIIIQTYKNLNCILFRDTSKHQIPDYLLFEPLLKLQPQINQFNAYSMQMIEFANSLGLGTFPDSNNSATICGKCLCNSPNQCEISTTDSN
jgi:hypothetical protein